MAISVGGHSMFQCCDKIKLGIVASSKLSKIRTSPLYSKSGNLFDNNEYNLYRNDFPTAIRTCGLNDTITLNALEKVEKLHKNFMAIFSIQRIASVFYMGPFIEEWPTSMEYINSCMCICLIGKHTHPSND